MSSNSARLAPLPWDTHADLKEGFDAFRKRLGFYPNSMMILQRRPASVKAFRQATGAISGDGSLIDAATRAMIMLVASSVAGCPYVLAHAAHAVLHAGAEAKLAAIHDYGNSALFSAKEQLTLNYSIAVASVPCAVTDEMVTAMRAVWSDEELVDITSLIALYGFFDRWNAANATPLEAEPLEVAQKYLAPHGWKPGVHVKTSS
ncbi:MAG: carboxymuconolactone decarboxylase family protein [Betaproteobacteria bacterium]|nr:carboxymuconolactone decarboxylase family protein [Betaproteobacteria bacterium]